MSPTRFLVLFHLIYFGVVIPLGAIRRRRHVAEQSQLAPRHLRRYAHMSLSLVVFGFISLVVAWRIGVSLFPPEFPPMTAILTGVGMYVVSVGVMRPRWRAAIQKRSPVTELLTPSNAVERTVWILVSCLAGISEEITWRGVQVMLLADLTGQYWLAVMASAISFAIAHAVQGWRSVLVIFVLALGFQLVAWLAGSLYVAMAFHIAYDVTAGLTCDYYRRTLTPSTSP